MIIISTNQIVFIQIMSKDVIELIYNYIKDKYPDVIKYITLEMIQNNSNDGILDLVMDQIHYNSNDKIWNKEKQDAFSRCLKFLDEFNKDYLE